MDVRVEPERKLSTKELMLCTVVLEKALESPLDSKEIKPVSPKGNQSWIFIGSADAEVETPTLWPPAAKSWLTGKDPDAGTPEDEMVGRHHRLDGHEFEQALVWEMDREAWCSAVHRVAKCWMWLSNWTELTPQGIWKDWLMRCGHSRPSSRHGELLKYF